MKLTKEQEAEVIPIYKEWWHSYLNGDVRTYEHYLDDDYRFVGSTVAEDFLNKLDTTKFFDDTAEQLAGKTQKRNSKLTTEYYDGIIFITELADAYLLFGDEWTFYGKFRFSSMLRKRPDGWRFIYQHFSVPDSKAQEGETIGFEQVSKENQELRDAIKRRTAELENKNRELEIESALDRVRSASMAMQSSEELASVALTVFEQLRVLGVDVYRSWIDIFHVEEGHVLTWSTDFEGNFQSNPATFPLDFDETMSDFYRDYKSPSKFIELEAHGDEVREWFDYLYSVSSDPIFRIPSIPDDLYQIWAKHKYGTVATTKLSSITNDEKDILNRFANVFEQAYTRFLDLQKAEAQAREAEMQLALERVRARAMAMQKSDELSDVIALISEQMDTLQIPVDDGVALITFNEDSKDLNEWMANEGFETATNFHLPYFDHPVLSNLWEAKEQGQKELIQRYSAEESRSFLNHIFQYTDFSHTPEPVKKYCLAAETYATSIAFQKNTAIFINDYSGVSLSDSEMAILHRFAKEFDQTYTRFLDLQKAEAQARESEIQLALERVRARTMAMKKSDELREAVLVIYEQLEQLHFEATACNIIIMDKESGSMQYWVSGFTQEIYPLSYHVPFLDHPYFTAQLEPWKEGVKYAVMEYSGEAKRRFDEIFFTQTDFKNVPEQAKQAMTSLEMVKLSTAYCRYGAVQVFSPEPLSKKNGEILQRFASVFEQTYTRFLDLQKAEAQTREALIETGLERARAQSMMMQHSGELDKTCKVFHEQLHLLGIDSEFSYLWLPDEGKMEHLFWATWHSESMKDGSNGIKSKRVTYQLDKSEPSIAACYVAWESGQPVHVTEVKPVDLETYFKEWEDLFEGEDKFQPKFYPQGLYYVDSYMKHGCFGIVTRNFLPDDEQRVLHLFAREFERTYTRFLDLKKAESQAREAKIEAALEKVGSRTMGMQSSAELPEVANMLFLEVQALGIPAWSSGFNILAEDNKSADAWMSSEGASLKPFTLRLWGEASFEEMGAFVRSNDTLMVQEIGGEALTEHYNHMKSFPDLKSIFEDIEAEGLSLPTYQINHLCKFNHGFLLFITYEPVPEAHDIFKRFTRVFNQTYTRFLDLQTAEKQASLIRQERDRLEIALKELHATQDQLVQQEKLASLGQLTAGIAHEIKNPLNFVNNFSDLSLELVEEVRDEIRDLRGETERERSNVKGETSSCVKASEDEENENPLSRGDGDPSLDGSARGVSGMAGNDSFDPDIILDILDDIETNLKTIHKHGSRADSIVKSMLQHSRGGDGQLEPTPLNPLIKEYANLAFHGMRAGKDPINVDIDLQLDEKIGNIPLIAEDFSRIILNLSNNAFDAMREKANGKHDAPGDYVPKLTIKTHQTENTVTIDIEDNGPGIPDEMRDKILQPFFTTKKGTDGTGLGLSITNDIVKAHGGEMKINSIPEKGTTFSIILTTN